MSKRFESWIGARREWWHNFWEWWGYAAPIIPIVLGFTIFAVVVYNAVSPVAPVTQNVGFGDHGANILRVEDRLAAVEAFMVVVEQRFVVVESAVVGCADALDLRSCLEAWAVAVRQARMVR